MATTQQIALAQAVRRTKDTVDAMQKSSGEFKTLKAIQDSLQKAGHVQTK